VIVTIADDFDLNKIADSGQCFRWTKTEENTYRVIAGEACLYITELEKERYDLDCTEPEYDHFWWEYFDLQTDYQKIRKRIDQKADPFLQKAAEHEKGIRILRQDPWEMLITFIISQNKNIPAIRRSVELLVESCGRKFQDLRGQEYYGFPSPDAVACLSEHELLALLVYSALMWMAKLLIAGESADQMKQAAEKTVTALMKSVCRIMASACQKSLQKRCSSQKMMETIRTVLYRKG